MVCTQQHVVHQQSIGKISGIYVRIQGFIDTKLLPIAWWYICFFYCNSQTHTYRHTHTRKHKRTYGYDVISKDDKQTGYLFGHYVFFSNLELNITDFCQRFSFIFLVFSEVIRTNSEFHIKNVPLHKDIKTKHDSIWEMFLPVQMVRCVLQFQIYE